ncbi:hypothetical protein K1T71_012200 [Dendrolimus kikuchii]|uniref:Uncharacterized protein n=1 Tax=Dendrolimus kikuchii TaxID=765133 RepID=A0ACC1CL61_9NEOP|nr:hypothetical protein K1T71_012200 [Dendrolimus kikuchii]
MWTKRLTLWRFIMCMLFAVSTLAIAARADDDVPSESQCRPYIEKALKELESGDAEPDSADKNDSSEVSVNDDTKEDNSAESAGEDVDSGEEEAPVVEVADEPYVPQTSIEELELEVDDSKEVQNDDSKEQQEDGSKEQLEDDSKEQANVDSKEEATDDSQDETANESAEDDDGDSNETANADDQPEADSEEEQEVKTEEDDDSKEQTDEGEVGENSKDEEQSNEPDNEDVSADAEEESPDENKSGEDASNENKDDDDNKTSEDDDGSQEKANESKETEDNIDEESNDEKDSESKEETSAESEENKEESGEVQDESGETKDESEEGTAQSVEDNEEAEEEKEESSETKEKSEEKKEQSDEDNELVEETDEEKKILDGTEENADGGVDTSVEDTEQISEGQEETGEEQSDEAESETDEGEADEETEEGAPEEDLLNTIEIPENLRSRDHINQILRLDEEASEAELTIDKSADIILRDLKRLYENSIKPLETVFKYRDLSNRHFGDPEIFSKPLVLFMGPWSGGKSSILNYLTGLEFTEWSLRTGAEPSPAYFNILMHGKDPEVLDGTQLAADWTFSGLQKFGQGLEERLRGLKHPSKILEKVNIVEIPGILEVRKQVSRVFPFNDACQWFIDRADIIFLVYDPSKLDVGPETEAILDQLKGRESQTRIVLNKADTVKPEELMRVQSALIWNISPLMSSAQPPVMYTVSLWSMPFEAGAPVRLLQAQERELLRDLRQAIDKRTENKIASARRFAVRVRNHAKMVDCYLTTYYNHKTIFGNRKLIADAIIENPQNYHIYEGLSTLTNISRYDLPDPETYRDFFRLNPLYEFQQLSATCTYFRGCPITRLDVAIAYDLPELVGKYKKMVETATPQGMPKS